MTNRLRQNNLGFVDVAFAAIALITTYTNSFRVLVFGLLVHAHPSDKPADSLQISNVAAVL